MYTLLTKWCQLVSWMNEKVTFSFELVATGRQTVNRSVYWHEPLSLSLGSFHLKLEPLLTQLPRTELEGQGFRYFGRPLVVWSAKPSVGKNCPSQPVASPYWKHQFSFKYWRWTRFTKASTWIGDCLGTPVTDGMGSEIDIPQNQVSPSSTAYTMLSEN